MNGCYLMLSPGSIVRMRGTSSLGVVTGIVLRASGDHGFAVRWATSPLETIHSQIEVETVGDSKVELVQVEDPG